MSWTRLTPRVRHPPRSSRRALHRSACSADGRRSARRQSRRWGGLWRRSGRHPSPRWRESSTRACRRRPRARQGDRGRERLGQCDGGRHGRVGRGDENRVGLPRQRGPQRVVIELTALGRHSCGIGGRGIRRRRRTPADRRCDPAETRGQQGNRQPCQREQDAGTEDPRDPRENHVSAADSCHPHGMSPVRRRSSDTTMGPGKNPGPIVGEDSVRPQHGRRDSVVGAA